MDHLNARNSARATAAGLHRVVVASSLGDVVTRVGHRNGDVATVLLHGAAGSWTTWLPLIEEAQRTCSPLPNIVAVDLPGWGESGELAQGVSVAAMSDVVAQVVATLGYSRWVVIGHSLGGHLALDLAARHPLQTRAVTLISATGPAAVELLRHPLRGFAQLPWLSGMLAAMWALRLMGPAALPVVRLLHRFEWLRPLAKPLFFSLGDVDQQVITALSEEVRPEAFLLAARAARDYDEQLWSEIRSPVLAIRGERDVFVGSADAVVFDRHIALVSHRRVEGAGHFAHIEQPTRVMNLHHKLVEDHALR